MIRNYPTELIDSIMLVLWIALWVWVVIDHDAFLAALVGFMVGLSAVKSTRSLYLIVWAIRHRKDDQSRS